jgi:hypothetical protein
MISQHEFKTFSFKGVALFSIKDIAQNAAELASLVISTSSGNVIGFDRAVWSEMSSGQIPSQLFSFRKLCGSRTPEVYENVMVVFFNDDAVLASFNEKPFINLLGSHQVNGIVEKGGDIGESYEEEDDFIGGLFGMAVNWQLKSQVDLPKVPSVRSFWLDCDDGYLQVCIGSQLSCMDDWLEDVFGVHGEQSEFVVVNKAVAGSFFYIPSQKMLAELSERVLDKEKVYLEQDIRGIRC